MRMRMLLAGAIGVLVGILGTLGSTVGAQQTLSRVPLRHIPSWLHRGGSARRTELRRDCLARRCYWPDRLLFLRAVYPLGRDGWRYEGAKKR